MPLGFERAQRPDGRAVLDDVRDDENFGKALRMLAPVFIDRRQVQVAEAPAEGDLTGRAQVLVAEKEDQVSQPCLMDRLEGGVAHVPAQVDPPDFPAKGVGYGHHLGAGSAVQRVGRFAHPFNLVGKTPDRYPIRRQKGGMKSKKFPWRRFLPSWCISPAAVPRIAFTIRNHTAHPCPSAPPGSLRPRPEGPVRSQPGTDCGIVSGLVGDTGGRNGQ